MIAAGLDPAPPGIQDHEKTPYPKYEEYEITPGDLQEGAGHKQKWDKHKNPYQEDSTKKQGLLGQSIVTKRIHSDCLLLLVHVVQNTGAPVCGELSHGSVDILQSSHRPLNLLQLIINTQMF